MTDLVRASFSIEEPLMNQLEALVKASGYANRSEFIRDMIRARLVEETWERNEIAVGTITMLYDHHQRGLSHKLMDLQHHHHNEVLVTTHVHLDRDLCVEVIMVRGRAEEIKTLCDTLRQQRGVLHADLSICSTGLELKG